ncbi:head-to-tail adaptor [Mycobacterium phage HenryJackson]|uniref:Head-to-tail adaptor n=1 Tax=Mycobacterium phage HenryJackson TaxID=2517935 RepID=A0A482J9C1_9CAUD|nr:head-to-tail adaptor [Mycobacterium phage Schadenfreude]QBP30133.1 head-to-tail adaptor [Mycobacterium phage HenryJackson]
MTFEWPINRAGLPALPELTDPPSAEYLKALAERNAAESVAVAIMWALSGRQFGTYETIARPCPTRPRGTPFAYRSDDLVWTGEGWLTCGCVGTGCRIVGPNIVHLPGPVHEVTRVEIGGVDLSPAVWVAEGNKLYRREAPWPAQDLNRPLGDVNTWGVHYTRGVPVPPGVSELTGILVKEILGALEDVGRCRLPRTVTTASRNGVTYRAYDPAVIYRNGKTGLPEIDLWLATVNPNALMAAPTVI